MESIFDNMFVIASLMIGKTFLTWKDKGLKRILSIGEIRIMYLKLFWFVKFNYLCDFSEPILIKEVGIQQLMISAVAFCGLFKFIIIYYWSCLFILKAIFAVQS